MSAELENEVHDVDEEEDDGCAVGEDEDVVLRVYFGIVVYGSVQRCRDDEGSSRDGH